MNTPFSAIVSENEDEYVREVGSCVMTGARCLEESKSPPTGNQRRRLIDTGDLLAGAETGADVDEIQQELKLILHSPPSSKQTPAWPDHVEPMPYILESMARRYLHASATPGKVAAIHLKDCFVDRRLMFHGMVGSGWIQSVFEVVMAVSDIAMTGMDKRLRTDKVEPAIYQLYMFYLGHLRQEAEKWYGRDSKLWLAVQDWVNFEFEDSSMRIGFKSDLPAALGEQRKLFKRVGIPQAKGFEMLKRGRIEQHLDEVPESQTSESQAPESQAPESQAPESQASGGQATGGQATGSQASRSRVPDGQSVEETLASIREVVGRIRSRR